VVIPAHRPGVGPGRNAGRPVFATGGMSDLTLGAVNVQLSWAAAAPG